MPQNSVQLDSSAFWEMIGWVLKAAGSVLFIVLTVGWREYRVKIKSLDKLEVLLPQIIENLNKSTDMHIEIELLKAEIVHLKGRQGV